MCARSLYESKIGLHLFIRVEQRKGVGLNTISSLERRGYTFLSLGAGRYVPRSMLTIALSDFFLARYLPSTSSRYRERERFNRKSILTRMLVGDIGLVANLPLPRPCSRRSTGRSGRRNRAGSRTCWCWSWSGRPWVSCSKTGPRSRCLTRISLLPFCASRSLPRPRLSLLLPSYAQRVPSSSLASISRLFYAKLAPGDDSASSRPRGRLDMTLGCFRSASSSAYGRRWFPRSR